MLFSEAIGGLSLIVCTWSGRIAPGQWLEVTCKKDGKQDFEKSVLHPRLLLD